MLFVTDEWLKTITVIDLDRSQSQNHAADAKPPFTIGSNLTIRVQALGTQTPYNQRSRGKWEPDASAQLMHLRQPESLEQSSHICRAAQGPCRRGGVDAVDVAEGVGEVDEDS